VVSSISVGSDPGPLALSDDASKLWVGIGGARAFREVDLGSSPPDVGTLQHLPRSSAGLYFLGVESMVVLPGAPSSLAMVLSDGVGSNEVSVFDNGVARSTTLATSTPNFGIVAGPGGSLFGLDAINDFFVLSLSPAGVSATAFFGLLEGYTDFLLYGNGRVFTGSDEVIDVSNPAAPTSAGHFPVSGPVALRDADSALILAYDFLPTSSNNPPSLHLVSTSTLNEMASFPLPMTLISGSATQLGSLIYAGGDVVAFTVATLPAVGQLVIAHIPGLGAPNGSGPPPGTGGAGGNAGTGDPCLGCSFTAVPAYGRHLAYDGRRSLVYVAADAQAVSQPNSLVTVDVSTATVTSTVPVGPDPQALALSNDGSILWVGLAGDGTLSKVTPGPTPVVGTAIPLSSTSGSTLVVPISIAPLPDGPSSIAVSAYVTGGVATLILDDGIPRANFAQPPGGGGFLLTQGPPGYLFGLDVDTSGFYVYDIGSTSATFRRENGFVHAIPQNGLVYSEGAVYLSQGEVIDVSTPSNPVPAGQLDGHVPCATAVRSPTRVLTLCQNPDQLGPILRVFDTNTFAPVASATVPVSLLGYSPLLYELAYVGGDAVALLAEGNTSNGPQLLIMHAQIIGASP